MDTQHVSLGLWAISDYYCCSRGSLLKADPAGSRFSSLAYVVHGLSDTGLISQSVKLTARYSNIYLYIYMYVCTARISGMVSNVGLQR